MNASRTNMSCEEFKKAVAADPFASFEGGAGHILACEECAEYAAAMQALDARILQALRIDTPNLKMPELPPITDDNVTHLPFGGRGRLAPPKWIALAASVVLAALVGVQFIGGDPGAGLSLAKEVLAHVDHEPMALRPDNPLVSDATYTKVVSPVGTIDRGVGLVTYARTCVVNGNEIPHLVIRGENGPITLLLMPDEMIDGAVSLDGDGVSGVILPVGTGSIALIGERGEDLEKVQQRVLESVAWSI